MISNEDILQWDSFIYKTLYLKVKKAPIKITRSDIEDIAQEVYIKAIKAKHQFDPKRAKLSTWLYVIVNSTFYDFLRDKVKTPFFEEVESSIISMEEIFEEEEKDIFLEKERKRMLLHVLKTIPEIKQTFKTILRDEPKTPRMYKLLYKARYKLAPYKDILL